ACGAPKSAQPPPRQPAEYSVADFYANTSIASNAFSSDHRKILVSSNATGVYNANAIAVTGRDPVPLPNAKTNAVHPEAELPHDDRFLYMSDEGGNELAHVYVQSPDGATKDLTPAPKAQSTAHGWAANGRHFWVMSNERDPRYFDLYEYAT